MDVGAILGSIADAAAETPVLLIAILLGLGSLFGQVRILGVSLGPAAVLFTALVLSAADDRLVLPEVVGSVGLAIFAYTIGLSAGPSFFALLRDGSRVIISVALVLLAAGGLAGFLGRWLGLDAGTTAGVYAGALTNTPALAAAGERLGEEGPVVGYSLTYLFGVLGMLAAANFALRRARDPDEEKGGLISRNVRVELDDLPDLGTLADLYEGKVAFSRIMRGDTPEHEGKLDVATAATVPRRGDILTVVGDPDTVGTVTVNLGHASTVRLELDRRRVDFRRLTVSNPKVSGRTIAELKLQRLYDATATRVRRGDVDLLATEDLPLITGDRVRVVAPRERMPEIAKLFGDSETQAAHFNAAALGLGLSLGVLLGLLEFPLPGGESFSLGVAAGALVFGLIAGRMMRTGPLVWTMPPQVSSALGQLGMLLFLAYAGSTAGPALLAAFGDDEVWLVLLLGVVVTSAAAVGLVAVSFAIGKLPGTTTAGVVAGAATQPAVLAQANAASSSPKVNVGYALVYPAAMIVKVIAAPLVGTVMF